MYVLLNGSFGVGKSRVARELVRIVPSSTIADPEPIGVLLQRVPGRHRSDFQHDWLWRRSVVAWARAWGKLYSTVVIPMAFSNIEYLNEIRTTLGVSGRPVLHFCLTAPLDVIRERLAGRGEPYSDPRWKWVHRRSEKCCAAHEADAFAEQVPTGGRSAESVARVLAEQIRAAAVQFEQRSA